MPRDGTETYVLPFPDVVADTTIESPVYNGFTNDVAQDLNNPRPITAGGTGATSAAGALAALGGEAASQVVTNYDSYVFKAGSFYSAAGATAAPNAHAFAGICYLSDASNIVIEARDATDGLLYIRRKTAGVWGAWVLDGDLSGVNAAIDTKVAKAGDTMTGNLTITKTDPTVSLNKTVTSGGFNILRGSTNGAARWGILLGDNDAESGGNVGSNFAIARYSDAGAFIDSAFYMNRTTGLASVVGSPTAALGIATKGYVDAEATRADARLIPLNITAGPYTTTLTDAQKCMRGTGARTINGGLAYPLGTWLMFTSFGGTMTVALSSGNLYFWNGATTLTGTRTLVGTGAIATAILVSAGEWVIYGTGIT